MRARAGAPGVAAVAFTTVAIVGVLSVALAARPPAIAPGVGTAWAIALALTAGLALAAAGALELAIRPSRRHGTMLLASAVAWFVATWSSPGIGSAVLFTAGLVLGSAWPAVVAHAAVEDGRVPGHWRAAMVGAGYATCVGLLGLVPTLVGVPDAGCPACPANLLQVASVDGSAVEVVGRLAAAAWAAVVVIALAARVARASRAERPVLIETAAPAAVAVAAFAADAARAVVLGGARLDDMARLLWSVQALALGALAIGVGWRLLRERRSRLAVAAIVIELGAGAGAGVVEQRLRALLRDPELVVAYPDTSGALVDASGAAAAVVAGAGRRSTTVLDDGRLVAVLVHRETLADEPGRLASVAETAGLALEHERLTAVARARLAELRQSRVRVVEAIDRERSRLERDLHDGAQQRLAALAVGLGLAASRSTHPERLHAAEQEVRAAIAELRDVAHGIYPSVLGDMGLAAALADLADGARVPVRLVAVPESRLPSAVELTAYVAVASALDLAVSGMRVDGMTVGDMLHLDLRLLGAHVERLPEVDDRVLALDGRLTIEPDANGTIVRVELPCGS